MNSLDIYNAMMIQHTARDQNSNYYKPRKGKKIIFLKFFFTEIKLIWCH